MHYVVKYIHAKQVSIPLLNTLRSAPPPAVEEHLSKPVDSQTNWPSWAVTWCFGIPVTWPRPACTLLYVLRWFGEPCPSTLIFVAEMEFDVMLGSHYPTCQRVPRHRPPPATDALNRLVRGVKQNTEVADNLLVTLNDKSRAPTLCNMLKFSEGKELRGSAASSNQNPELNVNSLQREWKKGPLGCTKAFAPLSTYFQRAWQLSA